MERLLMMAVGLLLGTVSGKPDMGKPCGRLAPGLSRLHRGVDITKLDLLPLDISVPQGYKLPVIDYTCDKGKTYTLGGVSTRV